VFGLIVKMETVIERNKGQVKNLRLMILAQGFPELPVAEFVKQKLEIDNAKI